MSTETIIAARCGAIMQLAQLVGHVEHDELREVASTLRAIARLGPASLYTVADRLDHVRSDIEAACSSLHAEATRDGDPPRPGWVRAIASNLRRIARESIEDVAVLLEARDLEGQEDVTVRRVLLRACARWIERIASEAEEEATRVEEALAGAVVDASEGNEAAAAAAVIAEQIDRAPLKEGEPWIFRVGSLGVLEPENAASQAAAWKFQSDTQRVLVLPIADGVVPVGVAVIERANGGAS